MSPDSAFSLAFVLIEFRSLIMIGNRQLIRFKLKLVICLLLFKFFVNQRIVSLSLTLSSCTTLTTQIATCAAFPWNNGIPPCYPLYNFNFIVTLDGIPAQRGRTVLEEWILLATYGYIKRRLNLIEFMDYVVTNGKFIMWRQNAVLWRMHLAIFQANKQKVLGIVGLTLLTTSF